MSARVGDLDLLVELGLGIHRRLSEECHKEKRAPVERVGMSCWYLAPHLGRRFLADARALLGELEVLDPGVWRAELLGRSLVLVSNRDVPVERDSVPVHLLARDPLETARELARVVADHPELWRHYSGWLGYTFPDLWKEIKNMARRKGQGPNLSWGPVIENIGLEELIRQIGPERFLKELKTKEVVEALGAKKIVEELGPKKVVEELGPKKVVEELDPRTVLDEVGLDQFLAGLTAEQRRQLKQRLT